MATLQFSLFKLTVCVTPKLGGGERGAGGSELSASCSVSLLFLLFLLQDTCILQCCQKYSP